MGNHCRELFKLSKGLFATTEEKTNTSLLDSIGREVGASTLIIIIS